MAMIRGVMLLFFVFSVEKAAAVCCPPGWTMFRDKCYKYFPETVNWATAEKNCQDLGANLASVSGKGQNNFLLSLVPGTTRTWIGGHDGEVDGRWLWTDGSPFDFTNWCPTEPNNYGGPENCLEINWTSNRCWNDQSCFTPMSYICASTP